MKWVSNTIYHFSSPAEEEPTAPTSSITKGLRLMLVNSYANMFFCTFGPCPVIVEVIIIAPIRNLMRTWKKFTTFTGKILRLCLLHWATTRMYSGNISPMPWLAIEHGDQEARNYFITKFSIPHPTLCEQAVLFDPDSRFVFANAAPIIDTYGVHGFLYTREKIDSLVAECRTLRRGLFLEQIIPPLTELLGANVISKDKKKVPTSDLEGKTVGLYFFEPTFEGFERTSQLLKIWNSLEDYQRNDFEVVLVNKSPFNLSIALGELEKKFNYAMSFYSIESCGCKLCRVFRKECRLNTDEAGDLIVLKPDKYQPPSYFAFKILEEYGTAAYPFTLERAVEFRKKEQQNQRVLSEFLSPEAPLRRGSSARLKEDSDTTVSKLFGKRVLFYCVEHIVVMMLDHFCLG